MKKCAFAVTIDAYLRNELAPEESEKFEAHYFSCPSCFQRLAEKEALLRALKEGGPALFAGPVRVAPARLRLAAAAVLFLAVAAGIAILTIRPLRPPRPAELAFPDGGGAVRGGSVDIVGPTGAVAAAPERLEWRPLALAADYKVTLAEGNSVLWTFSTSKTEAELPAGLRAKLRAGAAYVWRVRAFTAQGSSLAVSGPAAFRIVR